MPVSRRRVLQQAAAFSVLATGTEARKQSAKPLFQPAWASLVEHYRAPEWFCDAKFGIWAHWSAQCVPERGDWYARNMYHQGRPEYDDHLKRYGHPSVSGFMEIDNLWKAERWEPEKLLSLYQRAGAKYFVALANHHDNFDTYDSTYHGWNSVRIGPKRDIVGTWARLARERGMRFGVSNHSAHAWHWFQVAYGYDATGPLAGVRYDAYRLTKADGKGKWWEGLDPQDLYCGRALVIPDGITSIEAQKAWHEANNLVWIEDPPAHNPAFTRRWFLRCRDLIDKYRPDLLYFDNTGLPLGQAGLDIAAHFYNASMAWHGGNLEAVLTAKQLTPEHRAGLVEDVERGAAADILPAPWQTDTCIGEWHYNRAVFDEHRYKSAETVVQMLCDIVSKNGNLLLSIPLRGDGSIDEDEYAILEGISRWMAVNGESIYATRPWRVFAEGPARVKAGMFGEGIQPYTSSDIRFTCKGQTLYAQLLGKPSGERVTVISLASGPQPMKEKVERVELLGASGALEFTQDSSGLAIRLPAALVPGMVPVFRISVTGLSARGQS